MFHAAKGLVTPRYTSTRLLIVVFASMIIAGCARNGGDSTSESASASVPTAGTTDQETAQEPVTDSPPVETAPVLRDGRWYAPGQSVDSPHPYGFFEKDPKAPCLLVSPRGAVWLSEDTPVFRSLMRPEHGDRAMGGWLVMSQSFESLSDENFASSITHANAGEVEFVVSPVKDQRNATIATIFGVTTDGRYFKSDLRPSTQQREFGIERKVTEGPLRPGCPASIGKDVIEYQFALSNRHGGNYLEAVQQALQQPVEATAGEPQEATPGVTHIGSWTILDATSGMAAEVAKSGAELKFLARTEEVAVGKGGTRLLQVMCHRAAGEPWVLSIFGSYAGEVQISFDGGPTERFQHPWNPPGAAKFDAESMERLIQRLLLSRQVMMTGQKGSSAFDASRKQWTDPATFNVDGFNQLLAAHIAACPAPEAQAFTQAARTHSTTAQKDTSANLVPAAFHGTWAANLDACAAAAEVGSPPEPGAVISADRIDRYEHYCEVTGVRAKTSDMLVADVQCAQEGETVQSSVTLIRIGDKLRLDGGGDYVSCYKPSRPLDQTQTQGATPDAIPFERLFYCANVAGRAVAFARSDKSNAAFAHNTIEVAMSTGRAYARYADDHATEIGGLSDERQAAIKREVSTMALEPALNGLMDCAQEPLIRRYLN